MFSLSAVAEMTEWEIQKDREVNKVMELIGSVQKIGRNSRNVDKSKIEEEIKKIINDTLKSEDLYRIGIITGVFYFPGDASHVTYDHAFDYSNNLCAILLSKRTDHLSAYYLKQMSALFGRDGDGVSFYNGLLKQQSGKKKPANKAIKSTR